MKLKTFKIVQIRLQKIVIRLLSFSCQLKIALSRDSFALYKIYSTNF